MRHLWIIFVGVALASMWGRCTYDILPEPEAPAFCDTAQATYQTTIKPIIDKNCALSGCHVAGTKAPGDFTSYTSLRPYLKDTEFKYYVLDLKDDPEVGMPPNWIDNPGPKDLTLEELDLISCWVSKDYPE
ncbi:MAG TPA: hypothetical protein P5275_03850 [Saprospiraceae bacterium]|mgnify:FL=1|nr:hypothetical protein [Saprospiraceae bacterium]MCB9272109.1 hypothetical protein [Lewinellaceae bacterium]HPG06508.1 hypothetical protein [Saprospiraceae bacterium]HPQ99802.1 hypothetical protein [Saprospiraceae bacterium]HQU53130.1 hypothetical protein [Saprospiraceae bacterium]